jgi:hypothetical protein
MIGKNAASVFPAAVVAAIRISRSPSRTDTIVRA